MSNLSAFERAVLDTLSGLHPEHEPVFTAQLDAARVISRQNTTGGHLTEIEVGAEAPEFSRSGWHTTDAETTIGGIVFDCFAHVRNGRIYLLECYAPAGESTAQIDFETAPFSPPIDAWLPK